MTPDELRQAGVRVNLDLARLKALADGATPGPWIASGITKMIGDSRFMFVIAEPLGEICRIPQPDRPAKGFAPTICDQQYIAACDPQTILALLDRVEKLEGALWTVQKSLQAADADSLLGDVIWRVNSPNETLFDFVTATLEPSS